MLIPGYDPLVEDTQTTEEVVEEVSTEVEVEESSTETQDEEVPLDDQAEAVDEDYSDEDEADDDDDPIMLIKKLQQEIAGLKEDLKKPAKESPKAEEEFKPIEFITQANFEEMVQSPEKFNELLNKVHAAAHETALRSVGDLVNKAVYRTVQQGEALKQFFSANPALANPVAKDLVDSISEKMVAEGYTAKDPQGFLKEVARRAYVALGKKPAGKQQQQQVRKHANPFIKPGKQKPVAQKKTTQADLEFEELSKMKRL